jgi:hypothetical protein
MAARPQRIHITRGRVRDYVEAEELRRQTGMPLWGWLCVPE